jgi:hypothetical protein
MDFEGEGMRRGPKVEPVLGWMACSMSRDPARQTADQILESIERFCMRTSNSGTLVVITLQRGRAENVG